jgi:hypothetical protein
MITELYATCKFCLFDGAYLFYGVFVLAVSVLVSKTESPTGLVEVDRGRMPPIPGGELGISRNPPKTSVVADTVAFALDHLASFAFFLRIVRSAVQFIRTVFLMRDNPTPLRSFWRYLNVYYLAVVLPAAFMPPVLAPQRSPDFNLLAAVVLLICVNALGDVISVRIILSIFKKFEPDEYAKLKGDDPWSSLRKEATYYFAIIRGGLYCLAVLVCVLIFSSILYGVQIGQMDFGLSEDFFRAALDRALRFPELASTPYWFRGQPGPFGLAGIPGLFLYGLTTFLPIIILFFLALIWLFLIPFRIAVNLPQTTPPVLRVISAESAVFAMCLVTGFAVGRILVS